MANLQLLGVPLLVDNAALQDRLSKVLKPGCTNEEVDSACPGLVQAAVKSVKSMKEPFGQLMIENHTVQARPKEGQVDKEGKAVQPGEAVPINY